jgi:hypothetical protein
LVDIGAKIITPQVGVPYWSSLANATLVTFNETHPFVYKDTSMQAWFMWGKEAVHSVDWSYAMVTANCPDPTTGVAVFNADAWSPGTDAIQFDIGFARQWLDQVLGDGLSKNAT